MDISRIQQKLGTIQKLMPKEFYQLVRWFNVHLDFIIKGERKRETSIPNIRRGQILYVDFGYNVMSEFRYKHYCVAINQSPKRNPKVTVIPITSKEHPHQLPIGYELEENLENVIRDKERSTFWRPFRQVFPELSERGFKAIAPAIGSYSTVYPNCTAFVNNAKTYLSDEDVELHSHLNKILDSLEEFDRFYKASPSLLKPSYLKVEDITTISKSRIIYPRSANHPLCHLRLSDKTLDVLDQAIINRFTKS